MSYLLTGVTATGDDGHTAHFHDCRDVLISIKVVEGIVKVEYVHFIVKVPVGGEVWRVVCRCTEQSRSKCSFFRLGRAERVQGMVDLCAARLLAALTRPAMLVPLGKLTTSDLASCHVSPRASPPVPLFTAVALWLLRCYGERRMMCRPRTGSSLDSSTSTVSLSS